MDSFRIFSTFQKNKFRIYTVCNTNNPGSVSTSQKRLKCIRDIAGAEQENRTKSPVRGRGYKFLKKKKILEKFCNEKIKNYSDSTNVSVGPK